MRRTSPVLALVSLVLAVHGLPAQEGRRPPNLEDVLLGRPRLSPALALPAWAPEGAQYMDRSAGREFWVDARSGARRPREAGRASEPRPAPEELEALGALLEAEGGLASEEARRAAAAAVGLGAGWFVHGAGGLFWWRPESGLQRLAEPGALPPLAWVRPAPGRGALLLFAGHDLWLAARRDSGVVLERVTAEGGPERLMGRLDWVYQEEVYGRGRWDAWWWSPDGAWLAFLDLDTAAVPQSPLVDQKPFRQRLTLQAYPKPGEPNARCLVRLARASGRGGALWDPAATGLHEPLVVRVDWGPGPALYLQVQDREQRALALVRWTPDSGKAAELLREEREDGWIDRGDPPLFLEDGGFLWRSARDGYAHLYRYDREGRLVGRLTSGEWAVARVLAVDEAGDRAWILGSRDTVLESHLYRIRLSREAAPVRLTEPGRSHQPSLSPDRAFFLDRWESLDDPGGVTLRREEDGAEVRELARVRRESLAPGIVLGAAALHKVPGPQGETLDGMSLAPPGWDGSRPLPVWIEIYGGPAAPQVRNRWGLQASPWHHFLACQGVLVWHCDPRSASGRGHRQTLVCYQRLGQEELRDIEAGIDYLVKKGWADPRRVGITGVSYGGFLVNYALTHSTAFRCGIAVAGLSDWRNYDTIYTERYMRLPANNPEGYRSSSALEQAGALSGFLLLVHGDLDDNVHLSNTLQLAGALQRAGTLDFGLMIYPGEGHGVGRPANRNHLRRLTWAFLQERLLGP